jgi:transcriptional regulator with XRE-family HTH domain
MKRATRPGMPFATVPIAEYLDKQIHALKGVKTQRQIAAEIGYGKPNMISMFKRGEVRVPLDKIPALAKALEVDPGHLFRLALEQYWPGLGKIIEEIFGRLATSKEEALLIEPWRKATGDKDPTPTPEIRKTIGEFIEEVGTKL